MKNRVTVVTLLLSLLLVVCLSCSVASAETVTETISGERWEITYETDGTTAQIKTMMFVGAMQTPKNYIIPSSVNGIPAPSAKNVNFYYNAKGYDKPMQVISTSIKLEEGITEIADSGFAYKEIMFYDLPDSLTSIGDYAFAGSKLEAFNLGKQMNVFSGGLTSIGASAFYYTKLPYITIPEGVTEIRDWTFGVCTELFKVTLPATLQSIGANAFYGCTKLNKLYIPASVTEIDPSAFNGCSSLIIICPPDSYAEQFAEENGIPCIVFDREGVSSGNRVREGDWLYQVNDSDVTILGYYGTNSVITIPSSYAGKPVKALGAAFCTMGGVISYSQITAVTIPETIETIGDYAFSGCSAMEEIHLPSGLKYIGNSAFASVNKPTSVEIPHGVTYIGAHAFTAPFSHVTMLANAAEFGEEAFTCSEGMRMSVIYGTTGAAYAKSLGCEYTYLPYAPSSISITGPETVTYGKSAQLTYDVQPEELDPAKYEEPEFTYSVEDPDIVTITDTGRVYGKKPGTTTIYMIDKTDPFINTSFEISVLDKRAARSNAYLTVSNYRGGTATLTFGTTEGVEPFKFELEGTNYSFENVYMVNGKAERTVTVNGLPTSKAFSRFYTVIVTDANGSESRATASFGLQQRTRQEGVGMPKMQVRMVNGIYVYTQEYPSYKTVEYYSSYCNDTPPQHSYGLLSAPEYVTLRAGESRQLVNYEYSGYTQDDLVFFTADPEIATVDEDGTLHAISNGNTTIDIYVIDGSGKSAQTEVRVVTTVAESVTVTAGENIEGKQQMQASVLPEEADGVKLLWSSSDPTIATIDEEGMITWLAPGDVNITAAVAGLTVSDSVDLHWDGIAVETIEAFIDPDCDRHVMWTITPANATNQEVSLAVDNPAVVTLNSNNYFHFKKEGSANIRIMAQDGSGVYAILAVQGTPEHTHKGIPQGTVRPATAAQAGNYPEMQCLICGEMIPAQEIPYSSCLVLPAEVKEIQQEAFAGNETTKQVTIPDGTTTISKRAFARCTNLLVAVIPATVTEIGDGAFEGCGAVCLIVPAGSAAEQYAKKNGIPFRNAL